MNVNPGDIAIIIGGGIHSGKLVEVISSAPVSDYFLPNGVKASAAKPGSWVIQTLGSPFDGCMGDAMFAAIHDKWLRKISDRKTLAKLSEKENEPELTN